MPIIGLTDNVIPRFQRIGKLRKGGEKTPKGYGPDLDHFRFTSERPEIVTAFHEAYGKEPRLLRVFIPQQTMHDAFPSWCELWGASGLQHRCDGQTMFIWREGDKYARGSQKCPGGHEKNDPRNDSVGRLDLIIPELINAGYVGFVTLETHSIHDILHISGVLKAVEESHGDLRGVEFTLRRVQEKISTPGFGDRKGERSKVDKWLVKIEPAADWVRVQIESARAQALMIEPPSQSVAVEPITGEVVTTPQLAAPQLPPPPTQSPISPEEERIFGKPRPPVVAIPPANYQQPAINTKHPSSEMWARYSDVVNEAKDLGIVVPTVDEKTITAAELASLGSKLKQAIASKRKLTETEPAHA